MSTNSGGVFGTNAALLANVAAGHLQTGASSQSFGSVANPAVNTAMMLAVSSVLQQLARLRRRGDRQGDADMYSTRSKHQSPSTNTDARPSEGAFFTNSVSRREGKRKAQD